MNSQKYRVVLITGGSSGIGYEMARQMSEQGSKIIICGCTLEKLENARILIFESELIHFCLSR